MNRVVTLLDGKYEIQIEDLTGIMLFLRNGEPWPGGQERFGHAGMVAALVDRVFELEAALIHEYHEGDGGDHLGEKLMTDQDKIDYMLARVPK